MSACVCLPNGHIRAVDRHEHIIARLQSFESVVQINLHVLLVNRRLPLLFTYHWLIADRCFHQVEPFIESILVNMSQKFATISLQWVGFPPIE
jgi:hypothetical protein